MIRAAPWILALVLAAAAIEARAAPMQPVVEVFEDRGASLGIEEVLAAKNSLPWRPLPHGAARFGYSASRFWFRFRLAEADEAVRQGFPRILEVPYTYLAKLEFYATANGRVYRVSRAGMGVAAATNDPLVLPVGTPAFRLMRAPDGVEPIYFLSAESHFPVSLPLRVWPAEDFARAHGYRMLGLGAFFGFLLLVAGASFALALALHARLYLHYGLFATAMFMLFCAHEGLSVQLWWPSTPWWALREMNVSGALALFFYAKFTREFLGSRRLSPWLDRVLLALVAVSSLRGVWILVDESRAIGQIGELAVVLANLTTLALGLKAWRQGVAGARYFALSVVAFNASMALFVIREVGLISLGDWMRFAPHCGLALEVFLLFLALVYRIRLERFELAEQRIALVQSEKLRALGRMAGEIAHEISNPLAIIHGNASLIRREEASAKVREFAETIETTANRIGRIVKAMRALARDTRRDPFQPISLETILQDAQALCFELERSRQFAVEWPDSKLLPPIHCRGSEMCQVLVNLIRNAFDAVEGRPAARIRVEARKVGDALEVAVVDSGPGVPEALRGKIGEPFYTTKPPGRGLGLGLSISRTIVEGHGGALWLDEASKETRFAFTVPISKKEAEPTV